MICVFLLLLQCHNIISDREMIIGISVGSFGLCVLFAIITVIVVSALLYWRKHRERQYEGKTLAIIFNPNNNSNNFSFLLYSVEQPEPIPPVALLPIEAAEADVQRDNRYARCVHNVFNI